MLRSIVSRKNVKVPISQTKGERLVKTQSEVKVISRSINQTSRTCCGKNVTNSNLNTNTNLSSNYPTIDSLNDVTNSNDIQIIKLNDVINDEINDKIDSKSVESITDDINPVNPVDPVPSIKTISLEEINSLYLENPDFIYNITGDIYDGKTFILVQFNGEISNYGAFGINPQTGLPSSVIYLFELNFELNVISSTFLFSYDGTRSDYQYAQIKFLNNGDLIILASYTGKLTFSKNNKYININSITDGTYFLSKFNLSSLENMGNLMWVLPITALGTQNIEMTLDMLDNIYLAGTYQNIFKINSNSLTSSLLNDIFLTKVTPEGTVSWLRTSDKSPNTPSSSGVIRAESIIFNLSQGFERITVIGQYNSVFRYSNNDGTFLSVTNIHKVLSNLWVAQFDLNGNIIWMNDVVVKPNDLSVPIRQIGEWYITGYQIIYDFESSLYITGTLLGDYIFNPEMGTVGGEENLIYVAKISTDGQWKDYTRLHVKIPKNEIDWYPHLLYNDRVYLSVYGLGDIYYGSRDNDVYKSKGNLTLWINALIDMVWQIPYSIQASIPNPSINLISQGDDIVVIGSCIITTNNTNGYVKKLLSVNII